VNSINRNSPLRSHNSVFIGLVIYFQSPFYIVLHLISFAFHVECDSKELQKVA